VRKFGEFTVADRWFTMELGASQLMDPPRLCHLKFPEAASVADPGKQTSQLDVEAVWQEFFPRIRRAALMLTGSPWEADDLAQETFLVLTQQADRYEGRSSVYTWLYGILLNLERRSRRRTGLHYRKLGVLQQRQAGQQRAHPAAEAPVEAREWKDSLWELVGRLPDAQRRALVLRFSEELRYDEIAEILDCPLGTAKSRVFHGLKTLREWVKPGDTAAAPPSHPDEDLQHYAG